MLHHIENHIDTMRSKSDHVKKRYAFFMSFGITAIIFVFWLASWNVGPDTSAIAAQVRSPLSSATASVADAFVYMKESLFGANKTNYSADNIEVVGGKN
jgi:hypothetical protein